MAARHEADFKASDGLEYDILKCNGDQVLWDKYGVAHQDDIDIQIVVKILSREEW